MWHLKGLLLEQSSFILSCNQVLQGIVHGQIHEQTTQKQGDFQIAITQYHLLLAIVLGLGSTGLGAEQGLGGVEEQFQLDLHPWHQHVIGLEHFQMRMHVPDVLVGKVLSGLLQGGGVVMWPVDHGEMLSLTSWPSHDLPR